MRYVLPTVVIQHVGRICAVHMALALSSLTYLSRCGDAPCLFPAGKRFESGASRPRHQKEVDGDHADYDARTSMFSFRVFAEFRLLFSLHTCYTSAPAIAFAGALGGSRMTFRFDSPLLGFQEEIDIPEPSFIRLSSRNQSPRSGIPTSLSTYHNPA